MAGARQPIARKYWDALIVTLLVCGEVVALILAAKFSVPEGRFIFFHPWFLIYVAGLEISLALYRRFTPEGTVSRVDEAFGVARIVMVLTITLILIGTVFEVDLPLSARGMIKLALSYGVLIIGYRWFLRSVQKFLFQYHFGTRRTLIVGTTQRAAEISRQIKARPKLGYDILGFVENGSSPPGSPAQPVLGNTQALPQLIRDLEPDEVIITLEKPEHESLLRLMSIINGAAIEVKVMPDMYEVVTGLAKTDQVYGLPLIRINADILTPYQRFIKRTVDLIAAAIGLLVMAPLLLAIGLVVRLTSPGPAIFTQDRVGYRGRHFTIHKLRTMWVDAEENTGPVWATADDPRMTPVGRLLRRIRLDELPQLWNVLIGEMSLVGPRPERPHFVAQLTEEFPYYYRRLAVRPGITGWAQVKGNYDASLDDIRRKLKDDFFYIENLSMILDLKILLMTVGVVLSRKGH